MKPVLNIATQYQDRSEKLRALLATDKTKVDNWILKFQKDWTDYWKISDWKIEGEGAALPIGSVDNIDMLIECFKNQDYPTRITY